MHPEIDDSKVNGLLVSLGFGKLKGVYETVETSKEDEIFLENIFNDLIPSFSSHKGVYRPNRKGIVLTRTLTQSSLNADTWNLQKRNGLAADFTTTYYRGSGSGYSPTSKDRIRSTDETLATMLKEAHGNLPENAPLGDRVTSIYSTLLGYRPIPNAHTRHK
jgi:hypothetical protein